METHLSIVAVAVSLISLIISSWFAWKSMQSSFKSNELSESQKTAALISIIAPACTEPHQWKLFIEYLAKNNRLPSFTDDDEHFLADILSRLEIKASIVKGKLHVDG